MKVYAFLADGMEEVELLAVTDCLTRAGVSVEMVSVMKRTEVVSAHGVTILADSLIENVDAADADVLFLPGGMPGTTNLGNCELLTDMLKAQAAAGRRIAAICAAPSVLGELGLLNGKRATCYPGFEGKLYGATATGEKVVTDGNITTAKGMGAAIDLGLELIRLLVSEEEAVKVGKSIQYLE
ncbi:MAG: DJ-1/PfpI family protein [Lachnospiraceae bacterium]|nr:DJ-1/PfpI family protein [Lachnospiraceae bacterium]